MQASDISNAVKMLEFECRCHLFKNCVQLLNNLLDLDFKDLCHKFCNISYLSNSEYWPQISQQNDSIHSIILDVHVFQVEHLKIPFLSGLRKQN